MEAGENPEGEFSRGREAEAVAGREDHAVAPGL